MVAQPGVGTPTLRGLVEGAQREMSIIHRTEGPADDEAGVEIENGREIDLRVAPDDQLRRVADSALIGRPAANGRSNTLAAIGWSWSPIVVERKRSGPASG